MATKRRILQIIKLNKREWQVDTESLLGPPGGFGEVFRGRGEDGDVAIKRLKLTASQAAHRELQIGKALSERDLNNVVPILDAGQDAESDRYYLVMPICDYSLQDEINDKGSFPAKEAINVLLAILSGLAEVKDITHRDLKPSNVLFHEGAWKVADFGIAKFVEDSTSLETLRNSLTPPYAAPEQWLLQRPTAATDIYAIGCIAHALITGKPPFSGDVDSLREQHLNKTALHLDSLPPRAKNLVSLMLRKAPEIRPTRDRCIEVLNKSLAVTDQDVRKADSKMSEAVSAVILEHAQREAERKTREELTRQREAIFREAAKELQRIKGRLFSEIESHAKEVMKKDSGNTRITVGNAIFTFDTSIDRNGLSGIKKNDIQEFGEGQMGWGVHRRQSSWDLIAHTNLSIEQRLKNDVYMRSANIVFGRASDKSDYRWLEMAFWTFEQSDRRRGEPFSLEYVWQIDEVLARGMHVNNLAYPPKPVDGEDEDAFIERWLEIVAQAMVGRLARPLRMPMER